MSRFMWLSCIFCMTLVAISAEIQPVDVEPIVKKEQPDFEDDTGNGSVLHAGSSHAPSLDENPNNGSDISFTHAFIAALSMIIVTELGDKTFFIAAIMAMNHPRLTVFVGAMSALTAMHIMSALFGYVITWIPRVYTFYASSILFAIFGLKMLREGWKMKPEEGQEEFEEVQQELRRRDDDFKQDSVEEGENAYKQDSVEEVETSFQKEPLEEGGAGIRGRGPRKGKIFGMVSHIFLQAFTLTFLAEWGDRSQIATVVMAAREDVYGVIIGGLLGHFLCTGLAVIGGRIIATKISVRTVTIIGGITFLIFAASALIVGP